MTAVSPGRGGQTELSSDQTIFERTHVLGALELHGLEKASTALLSGQWSGTCLIRGHTGLGRSDQRQFEAHTSLARGQFGRIFFSCSFLFFYWRLLSLIRVNNKAAFWSELHLKYWWGWSESRGPAESNCRSPRENLDQDVFMQSSFIQLKNIT